MGHVFKAAWLVILISVAVAAISLWEPTPPLARHTWYEMVEAELTCTTLADKSERQSLNAPFLANPRDGESFKRYFGGPPQDERQNMFRYLAVLASIGWWAHRLNDQMLLIDAYSTIAVTTDRYLTSHPNDILFRQIARCARARALAAVLEEGRVDQADRAATWLEQAFAGIGELLPVEDWPLLVALREATLEPKARNSVIRLTKVAIDLGGAAMRANQNDRAGRFLAAAASGAEAVGDSKTARELIFRSMTVAGIPPSQAVRWRSVPVLYDGQVLLTGEKDAAKLSLMLTPPTPPAELIDQRPVFESYLRLSRAAETQQRWDDYSKFKTAASQAVADGGGLDGHTLLFMRHALGALSIRDEGLYPTLARNNPAWGEQTLTSYLEGGEKLLAQDPLFLGDASERLFFEYKIDMTLAALADLRDPMPHARDRIDDLSFRLTQQRSFGRLTVAMVSGEAARAQLTPTVRKDLERFLSMATRNGFYMRGFFNHVRRTPGEAPPKGDILGVVMFTLNVLQNETSGKFSEYLAYLRRTVPTIAELVTAHPLHLTEFQRLLRPGEALVATQVTPSVLYVWAITPSRVQVVRQRITETELTNTVTRLRASLKPSSGSGSGLPPFDAAAAHQLYRLIFEPFSDQLRDARTLVWYGHGPLGAVPPAVLVSAPPATASATTAAQFAALPFLVDRFAIAVLPDLSMFPQIRATNPGPLRAGKFLGIGASLLSADEIDGARRSQSDALARGFTGKSLADLPKLPEAADEMKALAALFPTGASTLWLGPAADEHNFVGDRLQGFGTIAFATHGFLADEIENLREPSLMLALVPNARDRFDGILSASDIASLRLNADLVILSACNTAGNDGRPHADAFTGLTQAFFTAGARNLMVSQWPVMSGAAVQLSVGTVERALNGRETLARSLQLAMQALRKGAANALEAHPAYWGPFVIAGDGR